MADFVPFGSELYFWFAGVLLFSRGMDFLSTWIATPNLVLEANPIAKRLGWRLGIALNLVLCGVFGLWPLPAVVVSTTSMLVAARNFQSAWLMRSLGERRYRAWVADRMSETPLILYAFCLVTQTGMFAAIGGCLMWFGQFHLVTFGIGAGMLTYALAVLFYTSLSLWRLRRSHG
jgi:hypothetical protein